MKLLTLTNSIHFFRLAEIADPTADLNDVCREARK